MAPPTRHSSRLGVISTLHKEDENAGALPGRQPVSRTLRGRKDLAAASSGTTKAATVNGKSSLISATNARKRILDDRTNNVKAASLPSTTALKATGAKKEIRKPAVAAATAKKVMVLDQVKSEGAKRTIKPIKKDPPARAPAEKPAPSWRSRAPKPTEADGIRKPSRTVARAGPSSRSKLSEKATLEEAYDAGHVSKKLRTSEPEDAGEKENVAAAAVEEDDKIKKRDAMRALARDYCGTPEHERQVTEGGWEDLDEGDEEDPLMVKEYVTEIYHYMRKLELETLPDSDYMSRQNELTWKMRGVLVDWIIEVHSKFRLLPETLYLAINLMDRFLSRRTVALIKFQLVGVTALFLAAKYEEVICPSVTNFLYMTDGGYDSEEILKAETYMLEMLEWDLRYPNPLNFLRRVSKADNYDIQSRTFAKYFMEISVVDYRLVATPPSLLAATSIWLARKLLGRGAWNANLAHYSGYKEAELLPVAQTMVDYILRSGCKTLGMGLEPGFVGAVGYEGGNEHGNLFKKYATRKFFRVSELVRDWAVNRYTYETPTGWEWDKLEEWNEGCQRGRGGEDDEVDEEEEEEDEGHEEEGDEEEEEDEDQY